MFLTKYSDIVSFCETIVGPDVNVLWVGGACDFGVFRPDGFDCVHFSTRIQNEQMCSVPDAPVSCLVPRSSFCVHLVEPQTTHELVIMARLRCNKK